MIIARDSAALRQHREKPIADTHGLAADRRARSGVWLGRQRNRVIARGGIRRDEPVGHVGSGESRIAAAWISVSAPARQFEPDHVAARHRLASFRADRPARQETYPAWRAGLPTRPTARGMLDPFEIAQQTDRHPVRAPDFNHLPQPAPPFAGTARAVTKLPPTKQHRRDSFRRLDRNGSHTAGESRRTQTILVRARSRRPRNERSRCSSSARSRGRCQAAIRRQSSHLR